MQNTSENDITQIETMQIQEILDLIKSQKFTEAFEKSKLILESQPNEQIAYNFLESLVKKQKGFEQIFELCELAMQKKYISQNQFVKLKAMALLNFKKVNESLELCNQIISNYPEEIDVYILKSKALKQLDRQEQIIEMWRQFVQQFCEVAEGYNYLIEALQPDDNYDELISVCDKAILKFPNQLQFLQKKGQILHRQKSYIQAIEIYDELIQKQKKEVEFYEMKISILRKYKKKISKQLDDNINKEDQNRLGYWINEQIKACYAQVIQEIGNESLEMDRIQFLYAIDEKQQAIVFLENMMKKYPKNVEGCLFKANILFDQKQFEQGLELYDEIISQDPENIQLYETKARQLEKQQRWVDALSCINQALQKSPQSLHLYLQKFNSLQKLNLIKIARQCIRMIPNIYYDTDQEMEQCDF